MATIRFITSDQLTDIMPINNDVDADTLKKVIHIAQENHIQNGLGSNLYNHIKSLIDASTIGDVGNVEYKTLLDDYIIPVLYRYSYHDVLPHLHSQLTDKGLQSRNSEHSTQSDGKTMRNLENKALNDAEFHENLMIKYICKQGASKLPEYFKCDTDDIQPKQDAYFSGIQFSEGKEKNRINRNDDIHHI